MEADHTSIAGLLRKPSAYIPLIMSTLALALLLGFVVAGFAIGHPPERTKDEGVGAHLFQLLIGCQVFPIGWMVVRWGPAAPLATFGVLTLHVAAVALAFVPVWWMGL